ncbi:ABC-type transport system involved in multi-copper enzyme maturation, permease component [Geodermatophilus saharensis]|uniref:ABC-type transport system involved in multi-copper enzyme maturation, permease component n=1 Tax=Geodermatophilus saharensis TaxID=1137994 RepID=A0A239DB90_9ACTN|nr:hypothetical protein [Geodermatophilus saharensis]SNS29547.1 ABC-type transport system involved in multi-copper enzyme maturation, permease component [Geodermatophilus saharensis]
MTAVVRSELVRLRRRGVVLGWSGLTVLFAVLVNVVVFQVVEPGGAPAENGPGVSFPSAAELLGREGIVSGLGAAASFFGVTALAFWALAAASDHSSGLVRVLVAAEPRRWRLLLGKWTALALATAGATLLAVVVNVLVAPGAAAAGGWEPTAWGQDVVPVVLGAAVDLYLSLLVWGTLGLALATLTRSAGIAIGIGVGWVLLLEAVLGAAVSALRDWLPGTTISTLAAGGTADLSYSGALVLGLAYVAVAALVSGVVFSRRDITD